MAPSQASSPGSNLRDEDRNESPATKPDVMPNFGATALGSRSFIDEQGVLPYHRAVYGPWQRPLGAETQAREKADPRLLDVALALNCWMPPAAASSSADDEKVRPTMREAREARREAAEAERLAAAADAGVFFEERAVKRRAEHTMDGLALEKAVREARCRPWDVWTQRTLTDAGIDAKAAERAVRKWEPQLFEDPIDSRHVAGCWEAEREFRARGLQTLVKEGWLWMPGIGRKWVMLRKNKGLLWSQAPHDYIIGMVLFKFLASFSKARDDECAIEFTRDRKGVSGAKVRLRAETPEEAFDWLAQVDSEFENFQINNGVGYLEEVRVLHPSQEFTIKLPAVDLNEDVKERAVVFHVKENQEFDEGDLLCEIERAGDIQPNVEVFARFPGRVLQIQKSRKENSADSKYSYFAVDDAILRVLRDPDWLEGERYLPRADPTDVDSDCLSRRMAGMELVDFDGHDVSPPSSRAPSQMTTRLSSRHGTSPSRRSRSTGRSLHDYSPRQMQSMAQQLVAATYVHHPDDFWTRNALLLSNDQHLLGASSSRPASRADMRREGTISSRSTGGHRQSAPGSRGGAVFTSRSGGLLSRKATGSGYGERQARKEAHDFSLQTLDSRYSSSALAAASKILLGST